MEMKECFEVFILQADWASINRYIHELVDRDPSMQEVDEVLTAFREAAIENDVLPYILITRLDDKSQDVIRIYTMYKNVQTISTMIIDELRRRTDQILQATTTIQ